MEQKLRYQELVAEAKRVLLEDGEDRAAASLDAEEAEAKATFEKAKADLERYDAENAKKTALTDRAAKLGIKLGDNRQSKELRAQPEFSYDQRVLQGKRETLEKKLDKARNEYGAYEPSVVDYKRGTSDDEKAPEDMKRPLKGAKAYLPINQVKPLRWYPWDDPRWSKALKGVNMKGNAASGIGPGEQALSIILGGAVQGNGVSFDVVTPDDRRWEVKGLESASTLIKPGAEGRVAYDGSRKQMERIMQQIKNFSIISKKLDPKLLARDKDDALVLDYVKSFMDEEFKMISKGELSPGRFKGLRAVLKMLSALKKRWVGEGGAEEHEIDTTIGLGDKEINVDKPTFIDVAKRVQRSNPGVDVLDGFEERELAAMSLKDPAFDDPNVFISDWYDSVDVNKVFELVDGVFIVNNTGFNMVPKLLFRKAFRFTSVSQGLPKFVFAYYNGTPDDKKPTA